MARWILAGQVVFALRLLLVGLILGLEVPGAEEGRPHSFRVTVAPVSQLVEQRHIIGALVAVWPVSTIEGRKSAVTVQPDAQIVRAARRAGGYRRALHGLCTALLGFLL